MRPSPASVLVLVLTLGMVGPAATPSMAADQGESTPPPEAAGARPGSGSPDDPVQKPADPAARSASGEGATAKAGVQPKTPPAGKPSPKRATAPTSGKTRPAPAPSPTPTPVLSFTDDDLLKYREPPPGEENEEETDQEAVEGNPAVPGAAGGAASQAPGEAPRPAWAAPPLPPPPPPPPSSVVTPMADPLRGHHAREADQQRRAAQIEALRADLSSIDGRLSYLKQKRQAIVDPLNIMPAGRTEEERQANANLKPKELLDQVDQQIKDLEKQREAAQERLAAIESRFGGGE